MFEYLSDSYKMHPRPTPRTVQPRHVRLGFPIAAPRLRAAAALRLRPRMAIQVYLNSLLAMRRALSGRFS